MVNTICVLIALGPNSVQVPCRIFHPDDTLEMAKLKCDELLGFEGEEYKRKYVYNVQFKDVPTGEFKKVRDIIREGDLENYKNAKVLPEKVKIINKKLAGHDRLVGQVEYNYELPNGKTTKITKTAFLTTFTEDLIFIEYDKEETLPNDIIVADKVFTSYYGGCGEAWQYILKEIEFESKFVCFNLD